MFPLSRVTLYFYLRVYVGGMQMTAVVPNPGEGPGVTGSCEPFDVDAGN